MAVRSSQSTFRNHEAAYEAKGEEKLGATLKRTKTSQEAHAPVEILDKIFRNKKCKNPRTDSSSKFSLRAYLPWWDLPPRLDIRLM